MAAYRISTIKKKILNNFLYAAKQFKWDWAGHIARQNNERWTYKIKNWFLRRGRRKGKQKTRWDSDIIKFLGENKLYHRIAYDRQEWVRLREAFAQNIGLVT